MGVSSIGAAELNAQMEKENSIILDIREEYEYEDDHLDSIHIPMAEVKSRIAELKAYSTIIVCCKSGKRARAISHTLGKLMSSTNILHLEGGLDEYRRLENA